MANPKSRVLPQILNLYLFVIVAHCVDVFNMQIMGDSTVFGNNLYGHLIGIIMIVIACMAKKKDIKTLGVIFRPKRIFKGVVTGGALAMIPIAMVAVLLMLLYAVTGNDIFKVAFIPPNNNYSDYPLLITTMIYALTSIVSVFLKELLFRGYVIRSMRPTYPFFDANIVQAVLCIPFPIVNHLKNIFLGKYSDPFGQLPLMGTILVFYVVHEFITGIKWGLLSRVSKDIWPMFFDHYFYKVIAFSLFFSQSKIMNFHTMGKLMAVQVISFGLTWVYYKKKRAEIEKKRLEHKLKELERHKNKDFSNPVQDERNERHAKSNEVILESFSSDSIRSRVEEYSGRPRHHRRSHHKDEPVNNDKLSDLTQSRENGEFEDFKKRHLGTVGIHNTKINQVSEKEQSSLMNLSDVNVNEFYREYAKEVDRINDTETEETRKKIEQSE